MPIDPTQLDPRVMERNFAMPEPPALPPSIQFPQPSPRDERPVPALPAAPQYGGEPQETVRTGGTYDRKPFGFALTNGTKGARIYFATLISTVTRMNFKRVRGVEDIINVLGSQPGISGPIVHFPANLSSEFGYMNATELGWYGNVYLYWEVDHDCNVVLVDIRGPDAPDVFDVPKLDSALTRDWSGHAVAKYNALIGKVDEDTGAVEQYISGDVTWAVTFIPENPREITTTLPSGTSAYTGDLTWTSCEGAATVVGKAVNGLVTFFSGFRAGCVDDGGETTYAPGP